MLPLLALEGPKFHTRNGSRGRWAPWALQPGRQMHDRDVRYLPGEPSLQGLVLQVRGEMWKAFWLASLGTVHYIRYELPLLMHNNLTSLL